VTGHWRAENTWPPADREWRSLTFPGAVDGGVFTWTGPLTVGSSSPGWDTAMWGSGDTAPDDAQCIVFETEPLSEPIEILGPPRAELAVTVDAPHGHVAVRLMTVDPAGDARLVARGFLNLAHRRGLGNPGPVEPGEKMEVGVPMRTTSALIPKGQRLRITVSGADFPLAWPPPGPVALTVDPAKTRLVLPIVPPRTAEATLNVPPAPERLSPVARQEGRHEIDFRSVGSRTVLRRTVADRQLQPARNDLVYTNHQDIEVEADAADPLATRAWSRSETALERGDWKVSSVGEVEITSDERSFFVTIDLEAHAGTALIHRRRWEEVIPRTWV
jgi:predicted acyl esterase